MPSKPGRRGFQGTTQLRVRLYLYTGTAGTLVADYVVPGDSVLWKPTSTKGYKYKDNTGAEEGIRKIILKGNTQPNKSKCLVKGKGVNLDDVDLESLDDQGLVTVQLMNDATNVCFESEFETPDFIKFDDPAKFKAKVQ